MPADLAGNAGGLCGGLKVRPIQGTGPVRLLTVFRWTGKDPVLRFWIWDTSEQERIRRSMPGCGESRGLFGTIPSSRI
jgi:hypothetical protein